MASGLSIMGFFEKPRTNMAEVDGVYVLSQVGWGMSRCSDAPPEFYRAT